MRHTLLSTLILGALCALPALADEHAPHWSYADAAKWGELSKDFATCKIGGAQSPINIETAKATRAKLDPIDFQYTPTAAEVVNNGHTIQVNLAKGSAIQIGGARYELLQFHFHTPSEEELDGKRLPMVAHLVHKNAEGKLAVVGVLFKEGKENAALAPVFAAMPAHEGGSAKLASFAPLALIPAQRGYYAFSGSLTTPPCSEGVRWQVMQAAAEVSPAQVAAFRKLYAMNARPVQPLNGRVVQASE
ncbi:carbonic anhydrase [Massilia sp. TS11]|uniref:carbonic anhydrase n=1 Tax=Massilia sp. TS11 TaxID=2908003 RepID=UPI001EDAA57F|nr:carbonic anhydrase family protein [Massilia sp. TS11]MCG2586315.1 carbonic anhydrase family protein [Massilia sp. TS11]